MESESAVVGHGVCAWRRRLIRAVGMITRDNRW